MNVRRLLRYRLCFLFMGFGSGLLVIDLWPFNLRRTFTGSRARVDFQPQEANTFIEVENHRQQRFEMATDTRTYVECIFTQKWGGDDTYLLRISLRPSRCVEHCTTVFELYELFPTLAVKYHCLVTI